MSLRCRGLACPGVGRLGRRLVLCLFEPELAPLNFLLAWAKPKQRAPKNRRLLFFDIGNPVLCALASFTPAGCLATAACPGVGRVPGSKRMN